MLDVKYHNGGFDIILQGKTIGRGCTKNDMFVVRDLHNNIFVSSDINQAGKWLVNNYTINSQDNWGIFWTHYKELLDNSSSNIIGI